jgi:fused signal recognition particle receptor
MEELKKMKRVIDREIPGEPSEVLIVLDAVTGQNGFAQASAFHKALSLTGVVLAKYDSTAKGGIIIAVADRLGLPIRYVGLGESIDDLCLFDPQSFVKGLLDMD